MYLYTRPMDHCVDTRTQSLLSQNKSFLLKPHVDIVGNQMTLTWPPSTAAAFDLVFVLTGVPQLVGVGRHDVRREDTLGSHILGDDYKRGGVGWHMTSISTLCTRKRNSRRKLWRHLRRAPGGIRCYCWCPRKDGHRSRRTSRG